MTKYPDAMLAAFRRIPLGESHDARKLKRWINTVWNRGRALSLAGEFPGGAKHSGARKARELRYMVRVYRRAATIKGHS